MWGVDWSIDDDDDEDEGILGDKKLLEDFEKMLKGEKDPDDIPYKIKKVDPKDCSFHVWMEVGKSPFTNEAWMNCKFCDTKKEDYDKK